MALLEFHHAADGRPVNFEHHLVLIMEPHEDGKGTFVRLGPIERPRDMHLAEDYDAVKAEVTMSPSARLMRDVKDLIETEGMPF